MEEIEKELQNYGIRPTSMRILIYQFLKPKNAAVSLGEIERFFEKSDRTTLYRTLKVFEEKCLVHQIDDGTGVPKYAMCHHDHSVKHRDLHLHFRCTSCNRTICLTELHIPQIKLPEGFTSEDMNMLVKGVCDQCSKT